MTFELTDEEISSLADSDGRAEAVARILAARKPAPPHSCENAPEMEAEIERWKLAARRMEAEAAEAGALVLSHEGRIERLQRDLEAAQADATRYRDETMTFSSRDGLASELTMIESMLQAIPRGRVLERIGLERRATSLRDELKAMQTGSRTVALTFRGVPVEGTHSIVADFAGKAVASLIEERDRYRAIVREALEVAHAGAAADERLPEIVRGLNKSIGGLEDERDRLRAIIVGLAANLAGVDG